MNIKNNMTAIGNLGRDCEIRRTQSGASVATFSIPVESGWGENKHTSWLRCTLFGKRAEGGLIQYLVKGQQVAVSGELKVNQYTNKEGAEKTSVDLIVDDVALLGVKPQQSAPHQQAQAQRQVDPFASQAGQDDEGIPF